jgi:hypothetical protein
LCALLPCLPTVEPVSIDFQPRKESISLVCFHSVKSMLLINASRITICIGNYIYVMYMEMTELHTFTTTWAVETGRHLQNCNHLAQNCLYFLERLLALSFFHPIRKLFIQIIIPDACMDSTASGDGFLTVWKPLV